MKKLSVYALILCSSVLLLAGCKKEEEYLAQPNTVPGGQSFLKINFNSSYAANPSVQLEVNKTRVSSLITTRTPFPGGGYNTNGGNYPDYLVVQPGTAELIISIPNKNTNKDSVVLLTKSLTLSADKHYTAHVTDTAANTKVVVVEDDITIPDTGKVRYKFINLMPNVPAIDLYYGSTVVATNIQYLSTSDFTLPIPYAGTPLQAWSIRETGTLPTSTALATYTSSNSILNQRVYTAFAVGYKGATDAVRKPYISFLLNH